MNAPNSSIIAQSPFNDGLRVYLAPMAGVADMPFRKLCMSFGCDYTYTEMISARALCVNNSKTRLLLKTAREERPIVAQLFGNDPIIMAKAARIIESEFEGDINTIDINMGCPAPKIVNNGEGAALMRDERLASRVITSVVNATKLPVSIKMRMGFDKEHINALSFARMAYESGAATIAVHPRTREQAYGGIADWSVIAAIKSELDIPIIGNGDIFSAEDAFRMKEQTDCDAVMIGRGARGNPFIFREIKARMRGGACPPPSIRERLDTALLHSRLAYEHKGDRGIIEMRKHLSWYIKGIRGASKFKLCLSECSTLEDIIGLLNDIQSKSAEICPCP